MSDLLRIALFVLVVLDPVSAAIGASTLATGRNVEQYERARLTIVATGAVVAFTVLAIAAALADPLLDALDISTGAAQLTAGMVVLVPALDLLWQGPAERVRPLPSASAVRVGVFPYGMPLLAGPGALAAVIGWTAFDGAGVTIGAVAIGTAVASTIVAAWRRPPEGRTARVLGGFVGVAMALVGFDLVWDGVFGP
jgi:multiple antibiotic resistance protein